MIRERIFMHLFLAFCLSLLVPLSGQFWAQELKVNKVEPANWWAGMKHNKIQLMLYGQELKDVSASFNSSGVKVTKVHRTENPSYAFIDIEISKNAAPGDYKLSLKNQYGSVTINFPVLKRESPKGKYAGFSGNDVIYMITPDRFANGDTTNDRIAMIDTIRRSSPIGRHGGDIQGIIQHLDYIRELGATAVWVNPVLENNTWVSYHGYGITDHYKVDPRFGNNELYRQMVAEAHKRGLKVILDHVNNHLGLYHPWASNQPVEGWLNGTLEKHDMTPHYNRSIFDINSSQVVRDKTVKGWFVNEMPDLNQTNPYVARYMIQNTIWWIEYAGIDGIREDTYVYNDLKFLSDWAGAIMDEYPGFNIVGEVWIGEPVFVAPFQRNSILNKKVNTNLPSLTDFPFRDASAEVFGGSEGMGRLYETIAKDYLYTDPANLLTFVDNHDIARIMYIVKEDMSRFKLAMQLLLTMRGIPQIYYGTEVGLVGKEDHGSIREDFPGGFPGSTHNAFTSAGRTARENEIYDFVKKLISIRQSHQALRTGTFIHYPTVNEVYTYFRISGDEKIFVVINNSVKDQKLNLAMQQEYIAAGASLESLMSGNTVKPDASGSIEIPAGSGDIFLVK